MAEKDIDFIGLYLLTDDIINLTLLNIKGHFPMTENISTPCLKCDPVTGEIKITVLTLSRDLVSFDPRQDILFISEPKQADADEGATMEIHWDLRTNPREHHPDYRCVPNSVLTRDNPEDLISLLRMANPANPIIWSPVKPENYVDRILTLIPEVA